MVAANFRSLAQQTTCTSLRIPGITDPQSSKADQPAALTSVGSQQRVNPWPDFDPMRSSEPFARYRIEDIRDWPPGGYDQ
jgi:hypothetical protein